MNHHRNLVRIKAVYHALEELGKEVVFVGGGATISLSQTDIVSSRQYSSAIALMNTTNSTFLFRYLEMSFAG